MKRLIFTIYIDIPEDKLDNPGSWNNETGEKEKSNKSKNTKEKLALYKDRLIAKQEKYAGLCGADYKVYDDQKQYEAFASWFVKKAPQISYYDIINFYKHYLMYKNSFLYDEICYFDLDVVPTTDINLFEHFDLMKFHVGSSTADSLWGRNVDLRWYNACFRSPSSKWYNAQAMAFELDMEPMEDVFNTGIMFANWHVIQRLNYFESFPGNIKLMKRIKDDKDSMYPWQVRRSFGYDNETLFSHRVNVSGVEYVNLPDEWHCTSIKPDDLDNAHLVHCISKEFRWMI